MPDEITTRSIARGVAEATPIVLRESGTRRLIFLTTILDNENPLRGVFVYQRKRQSDEWENYETIPLSSLKSGEGYKLELHSAEVTKLFDGLIQRKEVYEHYGIQFGSSRFVSSENLPAVIQDLLNFPQEEITSAVSQLSEAKKEDLAVLLGVSKYRLLLEEWEENKDNADEGHWQNLFRQNTWILSQLTASPVVFLQDKAYVGGKGIENTGGGEIDFLYKNQLTSNVAFIEIKSPAVALCGPSYRSRVYAMSNELTGSISQVIGYKESFEKEYLRLRAESSTEFASYNPKCFVVLGNCSGLNESQLRSFELFRSSLAGVEVLTFDELFARAKGIGEALSS